MKVNLIGAGKLGTVVAHWVAHSPPVLGQNAAPLVLQDVCTRSLESAQNAVQIIKAGHATSSIAQMQAADVWLLAVSDSQITPVAQELALHLQNLGQNNPNPSPIICHFSGALASDQLQALTDIGAYCASVHPILSFAQFEMAVQQFKTSVCALEGHPKAIEFFNALLSSWGAQCFEVKAENKLLYHAAAVFATNFLPVLAHTALQLWQTSGVPQNISQNLLPALLDNAVHNIKQLGSIKALTGPAARKDIALIHQQQNSLEKFDQPIAQAYSALTQLALAMVELKNKG